jgi:hypothetical protein
MNNPLLLHNVLLAEQSRKPGKYSSDSFRFPGHEERMAGHIARVRGYPCPCGSGVRFGDCCLGKRRCKGCQRTYIPPNNRPEDCPFCGSVRTIAMPLREVCG